METWPTSDHAQVLQDCMWELYQENLLTDVALVVEGGEEINVHKTILVAHSSYFKSLLQGPKQFASRRHTLKNANRESTEVLISFLYRGHLELTVSNMWNVLALATQLKIQSAVEHCQAFIESRLGNNQEEDESVEFRVRKDFTDTAYSPKRSSRLRKLSQVAQEEAPDSPVLGLNVKVKTEVTTFDIQSQDSDPEWAPDLDLDPVAPKPNTRRRSARTSLEMNTTTSQGRRSQAKPEKSTVPPATQKKRGRKRKTPTVESLKLKKEVMPSFACCICSKDFKHFSTLQLHKKNSHRVYPRQWHLPRSYLPPYKFVERVIKDPGTTEKEQQDECRTLRKRTRRQTLEDAKKTEFESDPTSLKEPASESASSERPEKFVCSLCSKSFPLYSAFLLHFARSHQVRYKCRKCTQTFTSNKLLQYHRRKTNHFFTSKSGQLLQCRGCVRRFVYSKNLDLHVSRAHPGLDQTSFESLPCQHCNRKFTLRRNLKRHLLLTHALSKKEIAKELQESSEGSTGSTSKFQRIRARRKGKKTAASTQESTATLKWACQECGEPCTNHKELLSHMTSSHPTLMYTCHGCRFQTPIKAILERHVKSKHGNALDKTCEMCGRQFNKRYFLKIHRYSKHGIEDPTVKVYRCQEPNCKYFTFQTNILKQHARRHQTEKPFKCDICGRQLKTEKSLEKHVSKVHMKIRPFICDQCGMSYGDESELKTHIARHGNKKFQCEFCEYSSHDKGNYQSHLYAKHRKMMEDNQRVFACDHCPYTTMRRARFREHTNSHLNVRPYQCHHCDKSFVTRTTLNGHVRWCHKEKSYRCDFCEYVTSTLNHLREHVRVLHTHREIKPYKCFYCPFRCAISGNCRKHIVNRHKGCEVKWVKICDKYPNNSRPKLSAETKEGEGGATSDSKKEVMLDVQVNSKPESNASKAVKDMEEVKVIVAVPDGASRVITVKPEDMTGQARKRVKRDTNNKAGGVHSEQVIQQDVGQVYATPIHQEHMYVQQQDVEPIKTQEIVVKHLQQLQQQQQQHTRQVFQQHSTPQHPTFQQSVSQQIHQAGSNNLQQLQQHVQQQQQQQQKIENIQVQVQQQGQENFVEVQQIQNAILPADSIQMHPDIQIPEGIQLDQENLQEILIYQESMKGDSEGGMIQLTEHEDSQPTEVQMIQVPSHAESVEIHTEPIHAEIQGGSAEEITFPAGYQAIEGLLGQQVIIMTPEQAAAMSQTSAIVSSPDTPSHGQPQQQLQSLAVPTGVPTQHFVYQPQQQQNQ